MLTFLFILGIVASLSCTMKAISKKSMPGTILFATLLGVNLSLYFITL